MKEIKVGTRVFKTEKVGDKWSASVWIGANGFASPKLYGTESEADTMTEKCAKVALNEKRQ